MLLGWRDCVCVWDFRVLYFDFGVRRWWVLLFSNFFGWINHQTMESISRDDHPFQNNGMFSHWSGICQHFNYIMIRIVKGFHIIQSDQIDRPVLIIRACVHKANTCVCVAVEGPWICYIVPSYKLLGMMLYYLIFICEIMSYWEGSSRIRLLFRPDFPSTKEGGCEHTKYVNRVYQQLGMVSDHSSFINDGWNSVILHFRSSF